MTNDWSVPYVSWLAILLFSASLFIKLVILEDALKEAIWTSGTIAVGITGVIYFAFVRWIWKWTSQLQKVHGVPVLEGTWTGFFTSTGNINTGGNSVKGKIEVSISQPRLGIIKVNTQTNEASSTSVSEGITTGEDGSVTLHYTYRGEPRSEFRHRSPISYGAAHLKLVAKDELHGDYWTDRKTTGTLKLKRKSET